MKPFSLLIPTYNRLEKLKRVFEHLDRQPRLAEGELLVGVDGSEDGTQEWLRKQEASRPYLRWFEIPNSGRAVIRNQLLDRAEGKRLVFLQDDILVQDGWLEAHLSNEDVALVGHMTWYPGAEVTPYMRWLEEGGHMLRFGDLQDGDELNFWRFYMGNISFPRTLVEALRFDERFAGYGWEDIVFGLEFSQRGHRVKYSQRAAAYHWDEYREEDLQEYMEKVGRSAVLAEEAYPGTGFVPPRWKEQVFRGMIAVGSLSRPVLPQRWKWYLDMKRWFLDACQRERLRSLTSSS